MKPRRVMECIYYNNRKCSRYGFTIDDCEPEDCKVAEFVYVLIYPDPDFVPFMDELNRRLDKGV